MNGGKGRMSVYKGKVGGDGAGREGQLGGEDRKGVAKDKGSETLKERCRKDSGSSVGRSVGSFEIGWGKKREREEEGGTMDGEERGGFKKSGKTERSPVKEGVKEWEERGGGGLEVMMMELVRELREMKVEIRKEREERRRVEEEWRGERRKWEEWMREEKARRERIEEKLEKLEGTDRRMVEVIEKVERWEKGGGQGKEGVEEGQVEEWRLRLRKMEVKQDRKDREGRRNNIVIRGLGWEGGEVEVGVRKLWERMGLEGVGVKEVARIGRVGGEGRGMVLVKLAGREEKRKVMEAKKKLKGGKERIEDDLTEEERRGKWKIEREAEVERKRGMNVQVGYMKMWVNGRLKRWDEIGEKWVEEQGNEKGGKGGGERG